MIILSVLFFAPLRLREKNYFYLFGRSWPETDTGHIVTLGEQTNEHRTDLTGKIMADRTGLFGLPALTLRVTWKAGDKNRS
jgi:hypothetical protein